MRTALVSDVHGNAVALEAVLADLDREPVDQVVALGDMAQGGPQPAEVVDTVAALGWPVVLGNADDFLLDPDAGAEEATERQLEARAWSVERLGPGRLETIRGFAPTV
ncbi:MAG: metallophosphoesterase family protein [Gaiellaceae bacterium]